MSPVCLQVSLSKTPNPPTKLLPMLRHQCRGMCLNADCWAGGSLEDSHRHQCVTGVSELVAAKFYCQVPFMVKTHCRGAANMSDTCSGLFIVVWISVYARMQSSVVVLLYAQHFSKLMLQMFHFHFWHFCRALGTTLSKPPCNIFRICIWPPLDFFFFFFF